MDNQNNPGTGSEQPNAAGMPPTSAPEQKCVTCGNAASGGSCLACGQGEVSCVCPAVPPSGSPGGGAGPTGSETGGGPAGPMSGGPSSPPMGGEQSPGAPAV